MNNGAGIFTDESLIRLPQLGNMETRKIEAGDFDGDGDADLFLSKCKIHFHQNLQDYVWLQNDGAGYFTDITNDNFRNSNRSIQRMGSLQI